MYPLLVGQENVNVSGTDAVLSRDMHFVQIGPKLTVKNFALMKNVLSAFYFCTKCRLKRQKLSCVALNAFQSNVIEGQAWILSWFSSLAANFKNITQRNLWPVSHFFIPSCAI